MNFIHHLTIRLYDTDAAGILYFGSQFRLIHDTFESWLNQEGLNLGALIKGNKIGFVIVHAESDYLLPLTVGDDVTIELSISHIGQTSFTCSYEIRNNDNHLCGRSKTTHVCVNPATKKKNPISDTLRNQLSKYRSGHL